MIQANQSLKILALETSAEYCSVSLRIGEQATSADKLAGQKHSELLLPMIDELLNAACLRVHDLDAVAFGAGPGSFTGIRIGLATANGLGWALDRMVIGISTLEAVAAGASTGLSGGVVALLDARRGELFGARFVRRQGRLEADGDAVCASPATVIDSLLRPGDRVVGDGAERYRADFLTLAPRAEVVTLETPIALEVARLASPRVGPARASGSGGHQRAVWPTYLREPHIRKAGQPR